MFGLLELLHESEVGSYTTSLKNQLMLAGPYEPLPQTPEVTKPKTVFTDDIKRAKDGLDKVCRDANERINITWASLGIVGACALPGLAMKAFNAAVFANPAYIAEKETEFMWYRYYKAMLNSRLYELKVNFAEHLDEIALINKELLRIANEETS